MVITREYLRKHLDHVFVFGDNTYRAGTAGAAIFREEINTYGFLTKKYPSLVSSSYYTAKEYKPVFERELGNLISYIIENPAKTFLITKLGSGLANKWKIWEKVIEPGLEVLRKYPNVIFLWEVENLNKV